MSYSKKVIQNAYPGTDGLPIEFYKCFWNEIHGIIFQVIQEAVKNKSFSASAARGVITLIEKEGKDPLYVENWRPLSLLNVDVKIFSKILATRLEKVLPQIICNDQTGFMKNRSIHDNLFDLMSMIEYCNSNQIQAMLVSYDFTKAFDLTDREILYKVMRRMNFPETYIDYIKTLYQGAQSCTINCGHTDSYFDIQRSLRQGCALSAPAFLILVEVLGEKIRTNTNIEGIKLAGFHKKHAQYADDVWALIRANDKNYKELKATVDSFCQNTGLKINYNKTQMLRIGTVNDPKKYTTLPVKWSDRTKILGVIITNNIKEMGVINYEIAIEKMEKVLNIWKSRSLTMIGRVLIVNTLAMSLFTHKFTVLPAPTDEQYAKIKDTVVKFIWEGKRPKIAYQSLIQAVPQGGLKLIDAKIKNDSCKIKWVQKLLDESTPFWKSIAHKELPIKPKVLIETNLSPHYWRTATKKTYIWQHILQSWTCLKSRDLCKDEIAIQQLWYNRYIPVTPRTRLIKKDILKVADIVSSNGKFLSFDELCRKYDLNDNAILDYYAVLKAIPKNWEASITTPQVVICNEIEKISTVKKASAWAYSCLLDKNSVEDKARIRWNNELNIGLDKADWENIRIETFKLSLSVKLRWFQYRLLSRRLTTNTTRNRWDKAISPLCNYCQVTDETVLHLLTECPPVKKMWNCLHKWIKYFFKLDIKLNPSLIILNNYENFRGDDHKFINTCILIGKQYIYAQKCLNKEIQIRELLQRIHQMYLDETFVAGKQGSYIKNQKKWGKYVTKCC